MSEWCISGLLAREWGVPVGSLEYDRKRADVLSKSKSSDYQIHQCGPPCKVCNDNSFTCGCSE